MRQTKAKTIRKLVRKKNQKLLFVIRNLYGDKTVTMSYKSLCRAVKKEYNNNNLEVKKIVNERSSL